MNIPWLSSLRGRLVAWYVVALVVALAAFGAAAVFVIDHDLHATLDARLRTTAQATLNFVDVGDGKVSIDEHDREQVLALLGSESEIAIVQGSNNVVLSSEAGPSPQLIALTQTTGFSDLMQGAENLRVIVLPVQSHGKRLGAVMAWSATTWIQETDRRVATAFALAALLLAVVAALAGTAVARRALEDAFARQRRFTADASHELRAPLAVIRAEADLALRKPRDHDDYRKALATVASEADRMERLVGTLLSAARAHDGGGPAIIDLQALAQRVCERFQPSAAAKDVSITVRDGESCAVLAGEDALERAVTAVLHNAIKHTPAGGGIDIWTSHGRRSGEMGIRDGGPGFSRQALEHGLEWFWCDDPARSGDSTGLGLAIADSIARANGGRVVLANGPSGGAQVVISLPAP